MRGLDLAGLDRRSDADAALAEAVPDPTVRSFLLQNLRRTDDEHGWRWQPNLQVLGERLEVITDWPAAELAGLPSYDGPVLWVRGERSSYIRDEDADAMAALFPRVRRLTVKNAGHWVHSEQPAAFLGVLRAFLRDV
jgi:pimeloyl-ACP methyl ester carboxylesterase